MHNHARCKTKSNPPSFFLYLGGNFKALRGFCVWGGGYIWQENQILATKSVCAILSIIAADDHLIRTKSVKIMTWSKAGGVFRIFALFLHIFYIFSNDAHFLCNFPHFFAHFPPFFQRIFCFASHISFLRFSQHSRSDMHR